MSEAILSVSDLTVGGLTSPLFRRLTFEVQSGELLAVLGPNGAGKTTLLRALLGLVPATEGEIRIGGRLPAQARRHIGYVPQRAQFDPDTPLRGRDFVQLGADGHRYGLRLRRDQRVSAALREVEGLQYSDAPVGRLSGGEQQRLRIAQALACEPRLLLVDEPLQSLDIGQQQVVVNLLDRRRVSAGTPVLFVTHDVNPVLRQVDRVLYLAHGQWALGDVCEVMTSQTLSRLYATDVDVLEVRGRIVVVGADLVVHH